MGHVLTAIDDKDISFLHIDLVKAMLVGEVGSKVELVRPCFCDVTYSHIIFGC